MTAAVSSTLPFVLTQAPTPAAAQPHQNGFAQMLKARQAEAPAPAAPEKPAESQEAGAPAYPASQAPRPLARHPARSSGEAAKPAADGTRASQAAGAALANETAVVERADEAEPHEVDPALAGWVANLNLPPDAVPPQLPSGDLPGGPAGQKAPADANAGLAVENAGDQGGRLKPAAGADRDRAGSGKVIAQGELPSTVQFAREVVESGEAAWQQEAERAQAEAAELPSTAVVRAEPPAAVAGLNSSPGQPLASRAPESPVPVVVPMPTPADSPEFPQALGTQLSVLARDGVQHAELHLNPSDMGPISVQIELNGSQAHVDFGADSAATREIIENGLPELAAALRDAGFTLSGGGVHQQARQGRGEVPSGRRGQAHAEGKGPPDSADAAVQVRSQARVAAGGVDLYA